MAKKDKEMKKSTGEDQQFEDGLRKVLSAPKPPPKTHAKK
jgi:hypothetical protein